VSFRNVVYQPSRALRVAPLQKFGSASLNVSRLRQREARFRFA